MSARQRTVNTSYGPDGMKAMTQAFDQAWSVVAGNISYDSKPAARLRLANALLSIASDDSRDVAALKMKALEVMALSYHGVPTDLPKGATT
jgi:hypothetical protein